MKIAYFPEIYEDELFYSALARFYKHSGLLSNRDALRLIYGNVNGKIDGFFLGKLSSEIKEAVLKQKSLQELIYENTLYPYYARFMNFEESFSKALFGEAISLPRTNKDRYLKYCPLCCKEEKETLGEAYYHRSQQVLNSCTRHKCKLLSTGIKISKDNRISFIPLEYDKFDEVEPVSEKEHMFDLYRRRLFSLPIEHNMFLNTELIKEKIGKRTSKELFEEIRDFYNGSNIFFIKESFYITKILNGIRFDTDSIMELSFFLGIDIKDLFTDTKEILVKKQFVIKKEKVYTDWNIEDTFYLPLVKEKINEYKSSNPPKRITVRAISQEFNFPPKRIDKLPICKEEIIKNEESYDDFRIRKINWAINKCKLEGIPINWNKISILTNIMPKYKNQLLTKIKKESNNNFNKELLIRILE